MATLSKKEFEELAGIHGERSVSIFLPTHQRGEEVFKHEDQIVFKNFLVQIEKEMEASGLAAKEVLEFMQPAKKLLQDPEFWRHQSKGGLAVFLSKDFFRYYDLPINFEPFYYHSHEFYLKPLMPLFTGSGHFYLLTLNLHDAKLYYGDRENFKEIQFEQPLPQEVEAVVGADFQERFLGYHAMKRGGHSQATFHGHGDWKEDEKDEILSYFRALNRGISPVLGSGNAPLVIFGLDYFCPLYQEANNYPYLYPKPIFGNPAHHTPAELHQKAWATLAPHFDKVREQKVELFNQFYDTDRTSIDIRRVVPAACDGKVDTLFVGRNEDVWGEYDSRDASVKLDWEHRLANTSLTNLAAVQVFLHGGNVYLEDREALPEPLSAVNALFRY